MPRVFSKYRTHYVKCPRSRKKIPVSQCYACPYYLFRNNNYLICRYELEKKYGSFSIVSKNPPTIDTSSGRICWTKNARGHYVWRSC